MRNLKRALSLTLASVMLLGMMVIGSSAAKGYPDVDENDNVEAIEVLQAVAVMVGDAETGNFRPDAPVSRAEMAVVMGLLLDLDYNYYVSTCPFADVSGNYEWARGWVGACAANGIIAGRSATSYDPGASVTAIEAASMMMRALGYFKYAEDYADGFQVVTVRQGSQIGIFNGIGSDATTPMTRNQVAQLALNALRSNMVDFTGTLGVEINGVKVNYRAEYTPRTGTEEKYNAITSLTTTLNTNNQYYVQLGEQLYDGKLKLNDNDQDTFGRPARRWEYDGKEIGTYAKQEQLQEEYTDKVTGKDLYDLLGNSTIKDYNHIYVTIDGDDTSNPLLFGREDMVRTNTDAVGGTGKGVLTQVYVDTIKKDIYIAITNTYLAIATEDYDSKNGEVDLEVYALNKTADSTTKSPDYIKDRDNEKYSPVTVEDVDIDVSGVKENDMFLVTVADGKVQSMTVPEVLADSEISSFKRGSDVVSEGKTYEYANTAKYDDEVLNAYSQTNLKDTTYNIILDQYGYLIGLEQNEEPDQYVFLTGIDGKYSPLSTRSADANIIHMDGNMETVTVNVAKSSPIVSGAAEEGGDWTNGSSRDVSQINTWCTYSVNAAGVYTLKEVGPTFPTKGTKVAQATQDADDATGDQVKIDKKNVTLDNAAGDGKVYGNDNTVYINVSLKAINTSDTPSWFQVIDDVDTVTIGAKNASLVIDDLGTPADGSEKAKAAVPTNEIYTLYKDNGYIIAAVVIGEDDGLSKTYAYIHSDDVKRETYDKAKDEWTWIREAIVDGAIVDLKEVGGGTDLSELEDMDQNNWYELKMDADGNVTSATLIALDNEGSTPASPPHSSTTGAAALAKDYVFCVDYTNHITDGDYPKFIGDVSMVREANRDNDTVILFQKGFTVPEEDDEDAIEYKDGTLYVNTDDVKGFDVSPEVKTVLCLSDGEGNAFDDVNDTYTGYSGLERAIKNLDSNFTGDLSVVFEKGSAVVIIFNDTTDAEEEESQDPAGVEVKGYTMTDLETMDVNLYGGSSMTPSETLKWLRSIKATDISVSGGKWNFTLDEVPYSGVTINFNEVVKISLGTTKSATNNGVTFTISNFTDQYVAKSSGKYTIEVVVTGTLGDTTPAIGTVAGTNSPTIGTPAAKVGVTPSGMGSPTAAGKIPTGSTAGAVSGTYTVEITAGAADSVITISAGTT